MIFSCQFRLDPALRVFNGEKNPCSIQCSDWDRLCPLENVQVMVSDQHCESVVRGYKRLDKNPGAASQDLALSLTTCWAKTADHETNNTQLRDTDHHPPLPSHRSNAEEASSHVFWYKWNFQIEIFLSWVWGLQHHHQEQPEAGEQVCVCVCVFPVCWMR